MQLEEITLALFAACNSIRVFACLPQIHKAATDKNGASAISRTTWSLFLLAHVSTIAYALVNRSDPWLALCFAGNAVCCVAILAIAWWRGRRVEGPAVALERASSLETLEPARRLRARDVHDVNRRPIQTLVLPHRGMLPKPSFCVG